MSQCTRKEMSWLELATDNATMWLQLFVLAGLVGVVNFGAGNGNGTRMNDMTL